MEETKKGSGTTDLTVGRPLPQILKFALPLVLGTLFHLAYIHGRLIRGATDLVIEVHPRHASFYRRMLGFRIIGAERICPRVDAPAVLMTRVEPLIVVLILSKSSACSAATVKVGVPPRRT